jgi:hypothetical protein
MRSTPPGDLVLKARVFAELVYRDKVYEGVELLSYVQDCARQTEELGGSSDEVAAAYLRMALKLGYAIPDDLVGSFGQRIVALAQK